MNLILLINFVTYYVKQFLFVLLILMYIIIIYIYITYLMEFLIILLFFILLLLLNIIIINIINNIITFVFKNFVQNFTLLYNKNNKAQSFNQTSGTTIS